MKKMSLFCVLFFILIALYSAAANPLGLSGEFRPTKIGIYWADSDEARDRLIYEYNKTGQLVKSSIFRGGETADEYDSFEYDSKGNLEKRSRYLMSNLNSYTKFSYVSGRLYEETEYGVDGTIRRVVLNEYDTEGRLFSVSNREVPYEQKNLAWFGLEIYRYDAQKRPIERLFYADATLTNKIVYRYEKNKLVLSDIWFEDRRKPVTKMVTEYVYVSKGKQSGLLLSLLQKGVYIDEEGNEGIDNCVSYTMKVETDSRGNMAVLTFYDYKNIFTGKAVIEWEKGKIDLKLLLEIFDRVHWNFVGC